ncbi:hypothetical protein OKA05_15555 [Luteolibacter arcticus]|uniref:Uncharacterized protein n=1 Tax=Luteolibacter arcticus TaxID=1581411 RepID=A0ABT3GKG5_9BACT|nr:hypothetical protein [Luteolibacter arcticus]MCW1923983.1 hypothetical protein [Luteolibacter arcticus]
MSVDIIPVLRKRSFSFLERRPEWRTAFLLGSLVLFAVAAAFPKENGPALEIVSPCKLMASNDPLLDAIAPKNP